MSNFLHSARRQFSYYKLLGEQTMAQLSDEDLLWRPDVESNSIAVIVKHLWGNMRSRWTDFLHSDGEKSWRQRDEEFEEATYSREEIMRWWNEGWQCVFDALDELSEDDVHREVLIRKEAHTVTEAIHRQLSHYPYHVGQMVFIGKMRKAEQWQSLSIPRHGSAEFNAKKMRG